MKIVKVRCKDIGSYSGTAFAASQKFDKHFGGIWVALKYGDELNDPLDVGRNIMPGAYYPFGKNVGFQTFEKAEQYWKTTQRDVNSALSYAKQLSQKIKGKTLRDLIEGTI